LIGQSLPLDIGRAGEPFWHGVRKLLLNKRLLLFLALVFAGGMAQTTVNSFLFLYMADMQASNMLMGLALTVSTISEIPLLFFGDRLLMRLGARGLLVMSMLAYFLRLLLYALNTQAWLVLPIQLLHGFTFSAMWIAGVSYANEIAPPGLGATAQGLFTTTLFGFSAGPGAFLAGAIYQSSGSHLMYLAFAGLVGVGLLLYWLAESFTVVRQRQRKHPAEGETPGRS
jgi:PPP family 3-phenylpropionic acid transporter